MRKIDLVSSRAVITEYKKEDYSLVKSKYIDHGTKYAFDVLDKKIIAGYLIQLACFRHVQDLKRAEERVKSFPYHYDLEKCDKILKFARLCPNVDTGKPTELMNWQKFILCQLVGWRTSDNCKRFSRAIVSVARGQGKTYLMAIIMVYSYLIESIGLSNQDFLVASINYKQTSKILGYIKTMLRKIVDKEPFAQLATEIGLDAKSLGTQNDQIIMRKMNNVLRAISHEAGQYDSFHFTTAIFDEIGELKDRTNISKIISGQVKVYNRQFIQISTAYPRPGVPFHEDEQMIQQAMEQDWNREADTYLGLIWSQDDLNETYKPETWVKSNPLLTLKSQKEVLLQGLLDKRDSDLLTGNVNDFQNKNLNMWLQESVDSYLKLADIERAVIPCFNIRNRQVYIGFDYSMFSDNTAIAFVYPYEESGIEKWHIEQHSFIPWQKAGSIDAKEKQDGLNYRELAKKGYCTITDHPQGMINDDQVYQWLLDYVESNNLEVIFFGYDTWGMTIAIKMLEINTSWPLNPIRQRTSELKEPTKFLQKCFVENTVTRLNDKIMEKSLMNAQIKEDSVGIQIDKASATFKIDVPDAIINAFYQGMYHFEDFSIVNDKSKMVERMTEEQVLEWFNNQNSGLLGEEYYDI